MKPCCYKPKQYRTLKSRTSSKTLWSDRYADFFKFLFTYEWNLIFYCFLRYMDRLTKAEYVTEFLIGNYMCYLFHQLKKKLNTEWMLYKCTNTILEQLQVMTILLKAITSRTWESLYNIYASLIGHCHCVSFRSRGILSSINKASQIFPLSLIHLDRFLRHLRN